MPIAGLGSPNKVASSDHELPHSSALCPRLLSRQLISSSETMGGDFPLFFPFVQIPPRRDHPILIKAGAPIADQYRRQHIHRGFQQFF